MFRHFRFHLGGVPDIWLWDRDGLMQPVIPTCLDAALAVAGLLQLLRCRIGRVAEYERSRLLNAHSDPAQALGVALHQHSDIPTLPLSREIDQPVDIFGGCDFFLLDLHDDIPKA